MSERLAKTFARFAEDAEFRRWNEERTLECRFVYVCQDSSVWKFTLEEWWKFVTKAIRNKGAYSLPLAKTIHAPGKTFADDNTIRYVNLNCWTLSNWTDELQAI